MDEMPLVSVVVPMYNAESFIGSCIDGVLSQTLRELELVCVDDGSTDGTRRVVEERAARDARVRLIRQENAGPGAARNTGIDHATGEFVCFLDADDRFESDEYLDVLASGARKHGQQVAAALFLNDRGADGVERDFSDSPHFAGYTFRGEGVIAYREWQFDYGFHRFLFSRHLFEGGRNRFPKLTFFEDPVFLARVLDDAGSFFATDQVGYLYRCEYKPTRWTTGKVLDFLEGVLRNLEFSHERGYARLHWYTVHHYDKESSAIKIGYNRKLDLARVADKMADVEQAIDRELLSMIDAADAGLVTIMQDAFDFIPGRPRWKTVIGSLRYDIECARGGRIS